jgi:hypothetical protein
LPIAKCRLPIGPVESQLTSKRIQQIGNWKLAIGNYLAVAEGFEPSRGRINSAVPYQLGYATKKKGEEGKWVKGKYELRQAGLRFLFPPSPFPFTPSHWRR